MTQHTKGPWHWGHNVSHEPTIRAKAGLNGGYIICQLFGQDSAENAQLIAAAPEMLEVLELLIKAESMQQGERGGAIMSVIFEAIDKARNVINKTKRQ